MKEIHFPKQLAVRFYFDGESPKADSSGAPLYADLEVIEKNGTTLIAAAVTLEERMIHAVSALLFGADGETRLKREFFREEIMGTSDFSFAFKCRVFTRLLERTGALDAEAIKKLKAGLKKVMEWRNAFAHGKVLHEVTGGFVLLYYCGGHQELPLNDSFFEHVQSIILSCLYECNGVIQNALPFGRDPSGSSEFIETSSEWTT